MASWYTPKRYNFQCSTVLLVPNFLVLLKELNGLLYTSKLWTVASEEIETACVPLSAIKMNGNANKHLSLGITGLFALK